MNLPKGASFEQGSTKLDARKHLIKLKKNLYGLKYAGLTWHEMIRAGLLDRGFIQSKVDPCLFIRGQVLLVLYVDDVAVFSPHNAAIDEVIQSLKTHFALTDEGDLKDYLGVRIVHHKGGFVEMTQPRMIERCHEIVGMNLSNQKVKIHDTPADTTNLKQRSTRAGAQATMEVPF